MNQHRMLLHNLLDGPSPPLLDRGVAPLVPRIAPHLRHGHDCVAERRGGRVAEPGKPGIAAPTGIGQSLQVGTERFRGRGLL
jgi:hypothetical protein